MNNNINKITFKKILVNPKLGYNSCPPLYNAYGAKALENSFSFDFA